MEAVFGESKRWTSNRLNSIHSTQQITADVYSEWDYPNMASIEEPTVDDDENGSTLPAKKSVLFAFLFLFWLVVEADSPFDRWEQHLE